MLFINCIWVSEFFSTTVSLYFSSKSSKRMAVWAVHSLEIPFLLLQKGLDVSVSKPYHSQSGSFQAIIWCDFHSRFVIHGFCLFGGGGFSQFLFLDGLRASDSSASLYLQTCLLPTKDACGVWKWIRDKNDDVYLHGECFQNTKSRLQSPMDDPPICTCCQESHGAHKWRRNKRMPARWCRCMATIAVFLQSITGENCTMTPTQHNKAWRLEVYPCESLQYSFWENCLPWSHVVNPIQLIIWSTLAFCEWPWPLYCWLVPIF